MHGEVVTRRSGQGGDERRPCARSLARTAKALATRSTDVSERAAVLLFAVSALVALASPNPLLQTLSGTIDQRVFPSRIGDDRSTFDLPSSPNAARVEQGGRTGCVLLRARGRAATGPVCNRHLHCLDASSPRDRPSYFEVSRLPGRDGYYVETGSACDSACCDWRGMAFTSDGARLDDGPVHRLYLRLGAPGLVALAVGALHLLRARCDRRTRWTRPGIVAGLGVAAALLLWNL